MLTISNASTKLLLHSLSFRMNKPKLLLATTHWDNNSHHSYYSGYQRIVFYLEKEFECTVVTWGKENIEKTIGKLKLVVLKCQGKTFLKKRKVISQYCSTYGLDFHLVFFLYSDIGIILNSEVNYVATVHNLSSIGKYNSVKERIILWYKSHIIEPRVYRYAKKIICISRNICTKLEGKYPTKVEFIPHGIDVHFWKPQLVVNKKVITQQQKITKIALCVGLNGVDIAQVKKCIRALPDTLFYLVGNFQIEYPNVVTFNGISDKDLRDLYLLADVFFRPLDFSTANNSLLEAMALGKKIVITRIGGVTDYVTEDYVYLADKNNHDFLQHLSNALSDSQLPPKLNELVQFTQQHYSWEIIVLQMTKLF